MSNNKVHLEQTLTFILERLRSLERAAKTVLSMEDCAAYTGIAKSYLYKLTSLCKIPHYKPHGKRLFFKREEIDAWLLKNPIRTDEEVEAAARDHMRRYFD